MKMTCQNARSLVPSYLDGELTEDQAAPLRAQQQLTENSGFGRYAPSAQPGRLIRLSKSVVSPH